MMRTLLLLLLFITTVLGADAQTLNYTTLTGSFNATRTVNTPSGYFAGAFDNNGSELANYANGSGGAYTGDPGVASFRTFTTDANANNGTARPMQVGDEFSITCYVANSTSFFNNSNAGISFNGGTSSGSFSNYNTLQRAKFQINKSDGGLNGNWFPAGTATGLGYATPGQDVTFKLKLTSAKTANLTISSANGATTYDVVLANSPGASNNIQNFVIWNQSSGNNNNMYWKAASLKATGTVEIGNGNGTSTFDGAITNGAAPTSTTVNVSNEVVKSGTGTITFAAANTYTGNTRIVGGSIKLSGLGTVGSGSNVYISNGASLNLDGVNATVASVQETGTGDGGTVALGSGTLTISGGWAGAKYQNSISGTGGITKQGTGILTLYGTQAYTGTTTVSGGELSSATAMASLNYTINGGSLKLNAANILPDAAAVNISSGTFDVAFDETIADLTISGGSVAVAAGKTLTINGNLTLSALNSITLGAGASLRYGSSGTLIYNTGAAVTISATEWPATNGPVSVAINSGTVTASSNKTIAGNLTVNGGTLDLSSYTFNRASAGGTLTVANGATLKIGGTNALPSNYDTLAFGTTSTVEYGGAAQVIAVLPSAQKYGHVVVSGSGAKTLSGNVVTAGNLTVNTVALTIASAQTLTVEGNLVNSGGTITFENNANLLQGTATTVNGNSGNVLVHRDGSAIYRNDFTMWSSPVVAQNLFAFSPNTLPNRFYIYNTSSNQYNAVTGLGPSSTTIFETGKGYLIRMPNAGQVGGINTGTTTNPDAYNADTTVMTYNGLFTGVPNNGDINVALSTAGTGYNLVGNPYPSPINITAFRSANTNAIDGSIWIWRKKSVPANPNSAYITINSAGIYAGNGEPEQENPNGILRTGQGFIVHLKSGYTTSNLVFTNSMRRDDAANQFFRMAQNNAAIPEAHGIWLNLTNASGIFSQMYTGYIEGATNGEDTGLDTKYIGDSATVLASLIDDNNYTIQARALPFSAEDVVPLVLKAATAGTYSIAIDHKDGLFAEGQGVYLRDNLTVQLHDLNAGVYSFTTAAGTFNNRFDVVFSPGAALSVQGEETMEGDVLVYADGNAINIISPEVALTKVEVYDVRGRRLYSNAGLTGATNSITGIASQQQLLMVKIFTEKGTVIKKIIY